MRNQINGIGDFKREHFTKIVDMFLEQWDLGRFASETPGRACGRIYLFEILNCSDQIIAFFDKGEICGIAGFGNYRKPAMRFKRWCYKIRRKIMINRKIKNKSGFWKYYESYHYSPKEFENYFDGDLSILIVDKRYRGRGLGKVLFDEICARAHKSGMKKMRIDTDDSCNKGFYERLGCRQMYCAECKCLSKEPSVENIYIFEKVLGETV
ncbi:MAG: GNAT family N-acetyltransferase [Christensenellaceae bacterium]|jgi:GNAT superfamily N-acetyltransferase|nr:GNAT family N-acetyltransferase [Christensenellaceae bacterium]